VLVIAQACVGTVNEAAIAPSAAAAPSPQRVLVLGWNGSAPTVIAELDEYVQQGSSVTVVSDLGEPDKGLDRIRPQLRNLEVAFRKDDTRARAIPRRASG
jgi:hypothetical protein